MKASVSIAVGTEMKDQTLIQLVSGPSPASPFPHCLMTELYLSLVADSMGRATVDRKVPASSALLSGYKLATCHFTGTV